MTSPVSPLLEGLVVFSTRSCMPCRQLKSQLDEAKLDYKTIDLTEEENDHYKFKYNIRAVPTVGLFKEDKLVSSRVGNDATVESLRELLQS